MTYSPSPWTVAPDFYAILDKNGEEVAWGYHEDLGMLITPLGPDNARLIAAAPELLEALRELARLVRWRTPSERWAMFNEAHEKAEKAIKEAGSSPISLVQHP